jgi:hypothetical protein
MYSIVIELVLAMNLDKIENSSQFFFAGEKDVSKLA